MRAPTYCSVNQGRPLGRNSTTTWSIFSAITFLAFWTSCGRSCCRGSISCTRQYLKHRTSVFHIWYIIFGILINELASLMLGINNWKVLKVAVTLTAIRKVRVLFISLREIAVIPWTIVKVITLAVLLAGIITCLVHTQLPNQASKEPLIFDCRVCKI